MNESCGSPPEKARKAISDIFQALQHDGKQGAIAVAMGVSDSTVSRLKNEHLEGVIKLLYFAGFKVVSSDAKCIPEVQARAWFDSHQREVKRQHDSNNLWTD